MNHYYDAWSRYGQFSGKASRAAFWVFFLVNGLVSIAFVALEVTLSMSWKVEAVYGALIFLPMLSLTVRRLHDTNRSAWWLLVTLIPGIGMLVLFILLALPSAEMTDFSDYPQNPKTS
jgi:uncharacterized membrane protein YhaH (DUF805 family)